MNVLYERAVFIALALVLLIVSWCMYDNYYIYSHTFEDNIIRYKPGSSYAFSAEDPQLSDEMVAWLTIDGTKIDYPVMQGSSNMKYLNTDPFGSYSLSGSIFLDSRNSPDMSDSYSVVYGHHMEHGKMFGALDSFLDSSYLTEHTSGSLIIGSNAENTYPLEVFASMQTKASDENIFEFKCTDIIGYIRENSKVFLHEDDKPVIALSTCTSGDMVTRTIVFCYIIK